jgi:hypothetical protein
MTRSRKKTEEISPLKRLAESFREMRELSKTIKLKLQAGPWLKIVRDNETPSTRLRELGATLQHREIEEQDASLQEALLSEMEKVIPDVIHQYPEFFLYTYMCEVIRIDDKSVFDGPVCDAFAAAKLDPEQLVHWRLLLTILCWSVFPPNRLPKHKVVWDGDRYCQLLKEFHKLRFTTNLGRERTDTEISQLLFEQGMFALKPRSIVRYFQEAKDPQHNDTLTSLVPRGSKSLMESYCSRGLSWPPADLDCVLKRIRKLSLAEDISSAAEPDGIFADSESAFRLFNILRAISRRNLLRAMRHNKFATRQVKAFLDSRRKNDQGALFDALSPVSDYNAFVKLLDLTLKQDETAFTTYALTEVVALGEDRLFKALSDMREKQLEKLDKAVADYYCDRIANGLIDPSVASEGG